MARRPELLLFAKRPVAGEVMTRLQPDYNLEQAAEIAAELLRLTVKLAIESWPDDIYLYCTPDAEHPLFSELARAHGLTLKTQSGGDLGERMHAALSEGIARSGAAAVFGSDVPHCPWDTIDQANHWLARGRNVIGPSEDGGYYLIGLQAPAPGLFQNMPWGGPHVATLTLERAAAAGLEFETLPMMRDIDNAVDLWLAAQNLRTLRRFI